MSYFNARKFASVVLLVSAVSVVLAAQSPDLRFDIVRYKVEGNTLLNEEEIEKLVSPFVGRQRDFGDVQRVVEALELAYRRAGFSAVQVYMPEQQLEGGVVTLKVIEARVGSVSIHGSRFHDDRNIRGSLPALREGATPSADRISDNVLVANENPAKQVSVTLHAGASENEVDAKVEVADENPQRVFLTLDNTGSTETGRHRLGIGYQHANIANRDQSLTLQYVTSPEEPSKVGIYSFGYRIPLYAVGDTLDFYAGYSDVNAGTTDTPAGPLQFSGKGKIFGTRYTQFLSRHGEYEQKVGYGFDYRAYDNTCSLGIFGAAGCGSAAADVTVHPVSLTYSGQWNRATSQSGFYVSVARNIPGGDKGKEADFLAARVAANDNYKIWRFGANHSMALGGDWQVRLAVNAQYTPDALVSGEQFGVGGANSVRGFQEREVASDKGYGGNLELYSPDFGPKTGVASANMRALLFYDFGKVRRNRLQPGDLSPIAISSAGAGLRFGVKKNISLGLDWAKVLDGDGVRSKGDHRSHLSMVLAY